MEASFGQSFEDVRIHAGPRGAESARSLGALAFTLGRDVSFATGQYAPGTSAGRRLIAHELAHVVQQRARPERVIRRQPNCDDLWGQIQEAVAELIRRAGELVADPLGLQWDNWNTPKIFPDGRNAGSVAGHQQQYEGWRNRLRNLITDWDDNDCNSRTGKRIPQSARDLQFAPVPAPTPRPRPDTAPAPWEGPGARRIASTARGAAIGA
ncbi:MAG: DUF4157 domain-containing protein, partial [Actinomycetota bacterium]|nr:DUF4157 domain-containing protein [Actinomycetota bacterium]